MTTFSINLNFQVYKNNLLLLFTGRLQLYQLLGLAIIIQEVTQKDCWQYWFSYLEFSLNHTSWESLLIFFISFSNLTKTLVMVINLTCSLKCLKRDTMMKKTFLKSLKTKLKTTSTTDGKMTDAKQSIVKMNLIYFSKCHILFRIL